MLLTIAIFVLQNWLGTMNTIKNFIKFDVDFYINANHQIRKWMNLPSKPVCHKLATFSKKQTNTIDQIGNFLDWQMPSINCFGHLN